MYRAVILPLAKQDIKKAAAWYESKQKGLGKRFVKEVRRKVLFVRQKPLATAVRYDDTRCTVLEVFPFMVHFTVDDGLKLVVVLPYSTLRSALICGRKDNKLFIVLCLK